MVFERIPFRPASIHLVAKRLSPCHIKPKWLWVQKRAVRPIPLVARHSSLEGDFHGRDPYAGTRAGEPDSAPNQPRSR
jgi:hypothetical protein